MWLPKKTSRVKHKPVRNGGSGRPNYVTTNASSVISLKRNRSEENVLYVDLRTALIPRKLSSSERVRKSKRVRELDCDVSRVDETGRRDSSIGSRSSLWKIVGQGHWCSETSRWWVTGEWRHHWRHSDVIASAADTIKRCSEWRTLSALLVSTLNLSFCLPLIHKRWRLIQLCTVFIV